MSRSAYTVRHKYTGNGSVKAYTFDFKITALDQLQVKVYDSDGVLIHDLRGTDATFIDTVSYTDAGGTVTLLANLTLNHVIVILLADDQPDQEYEFRGSTTFKMGTIEALADRLAGALQRAIYLSKRAVKLPDILEDNTAFDLELPTDLMTNGADKLLQINAAGTGFDFGPSATQMAASEAAALAAAAAAAISQAAAGASETAAASSAAAASASEVAAAASALAAAASEASVAADAATASAAALSATASQAAASASEVAAAASQAAALISQNAASASAAAALVSAGNAATSETNAAASQVAAAASAAAAAANELKPKGYQAITNGQQEVTVTFSGGYDYGNSDYGVSPTIRNTVDADDDVLFLSYYIKTKSGTGFTVRFNTPVNSANYILDYVTR